MPKLTNEQLVSIIKAHRASSLGDLNAELTNERATALDHYYGRPYGDEQDGRSQVVSRDLAETVDWIMPAIMRMFLQSGNLAEFIPHGLEDEASAQQESDYVNHVIMEENDGFLLIHDWVKDTLLLKNGYVKHLWEDNEKISESRYEGLTEDEVQQLLSSFGNAIVDIVGQEARLIEVEGIPIPVFDLHIKVTKKEGRVCIDAVPTEEVRVSKRCRGSLQNSPFTEHVTRKTRSELREMGMPRSFVEECPAYGYDDISGQKIARDSVSDESSSIDGEVIDRSMEEVEYCEAILMVDYDGDGIAELRKVVTIGNRIPPGEEWNEVLESVPMTGMVCKRMPHRHVGQSLDDELDDLQRIKTVLTRQLLDNIYLTNNQEVLVNERAHLPDFMTSLPGGIKRIKGEMPVGEAAMPLIRQPIIDQILPALDYVDNIKGSRTGIDRTSTGLDPDTLRQATKGAFIENLNRASQKVEMIARMLAETGVKELVRRVHELLLKHQDKEKIVKLRGQYVPVNPREWQERTNLKVRVGLGTGSGEERRQNLAIVQAGQDRLAAGGLVGDQEAYNLFTDLVQSLGIDIPEKYAIRPDPNNEKYKKVVEARSAPTPNPIAEVEQIKGQMLLQREDMRLSFEAQRLQHEHAMHEMQARLDAMNAEAERRSREAIAIMNNEIKALIEGAKIDIAQKGIGAEVGTQG